MVDFTSLYLFAYVVVYKRFRNTELFVTGSLFNIFILLIIMAIVRTDFNIAGGFGLFALLSLVQLRSAQFTKTEMGFLFGCISLAVINGAGISDFSFVLLCNFVVIITGWIFSSWAVEHSANIIPKDSARKIAVTLDHIDENILNNKPQMLNKLTELLGVEISSFDVKKVDYVRDTVNLNALYQVPDTEIPQHMNNVGTEMDEASEELSRAELQTAETIESSFVKQPE
jgi:hypothetical protein